MNKSITLYFNTGFNAINFPANPEMLMLFDHKDYPAMDLVQENFLSSIRIKAFEDEIIDADYLQIGNAYYSIDSYFMSSSDIVTFSISQNAILSIGGIDELEYITGEVARSTAIDFIDMDFDDYTIKDELLSYSERRPTLKLSAFDNEYYLDSDVTYENKWYGNEFNWMQSDNGGSYNLDIFTSSYDDEVPEKPDSSEKDVLLGKEGAAVWSTLETAWINPRQFSTTIRLVGHDIAHSTDLVYTMPAVAMYTGQKIVNAALVMYGFGKDNFIIDSYTIPRDFVDVEKNGGHITELIGKSNRAIISLGPKYDRVLDDTQYENLNPIIREIIANQVIDVSIESVATGASNTVPFSELSSDAVGSVEVKQIYIDMIADPSPNGCPYYKMLVKDRYGDTGTTDGNAIDIMLGSIRGASWMNNPLVLEGYGRTRDSLLLDTQNALRKTMYANSAEYQNDVLFENGMARVVNTASLGIVKGYQANANLSNARSNNVYDLVQHYDGNNLDEIAVRGHQRMSNARSANMGLAVGFGITALGNIYGHQQESSIIQSEQHMYEMNIAAQRNAELAQNAITHRGFDYELKFPISDNGQLLYGNGILINIKSMSKRDLTRYIRVLQQFGIACTGKMNRVLVSRFNNEPYHYIQAVGVSVKYADDASIKRKINKRLLTAVSAMFEAGFRIWYEKPEDNSYQKMYVKEVQ